MDRNLAMEFVRATEAAAISSGRWMGRGDEKAADKAAVEAMRKMFSTISVKGTVVIGEEHKALFIETGATQDQPLQGAVHA